MKEYQNIGQIEEAVKATQHQQVALWQLRRLNDLWKEKGLMLHFDDNEHAIKRAKLFITVPEHKEAYPTLCQSIQLLKELGYL